MNKEYILTIFSENKVGLLSQITTAFTYRNINIESMTVSESAINGIHKYTVSVYADPEKVEKLAKHIEKKIEVLKVFVFTPDEVVQQEIALFKVARNKNIENLVREHHVRILEIDDNYIILEKSGHKHETQALFKLLQPYGVYQFVRSGLVAVSKSKKELLTDFLQAQTTQSNN